MNKNRKGKIAISRDIIRDIDNGMAPHLFSLFGRFIPVYIQDNPMSRQIIYYGYSNEFDEIEESCEAPTYETILTVNSENSTLQFKRLP